MAGGGGARAEDGHEPCSWPGSPGSWRLNPTGSLLSLCPQRAGRGPGAKTAWWPPGQLDLSWRLSERRLGSGQRESHCRGRPRDDLEEETAVEACPEAGSAAPEGSGPWRQGAAENAGTRGRVSRSKPTSCSGINPNQFLDSDTFQSRRK